MQTSLALPRNVRLYYISGREAQVQQVPIADIARGPLATGRGGNDIASMLPCDTHQKRLRGDRHWYDHTAIGLGFAK